MPSPRWLLPSFVAVCVLGAAPAPAPRAGGIYVATLPDAADVWLDGSYVGRSPVLLDGLSPGKHTITVSRYGWESQDASVAIDPGTLAGTLLQLQAASGAKGGTGRVQLHGTAATSATLDGAPLKLDAQGGAIVPSGEHLLVVHTARERFDRAIRVYPQMSTDVVLAEPHASDPGRSRVVAPAEDYLPSSAFRVSGTSVVVKYKTHVVTAHVGDTSYVMDGKTVSFDSGPVVLHDKLYLPLTLLVAVAGAKE